jgi:leishmanolysin-like peptidase
VLTSNLLLCFLQESIRHPAPDEGIFCLRLPNIVTCFLVDSRVFLKQRVLIPAATAWLEKALKVQDVKDSTIKVQRNCPSDHHLINGLRYCVGSCSSTTKCGKAIVPESHLERCHTCDDDKQTNCGATGVTNPGVTGHDLILYVTATACSNGEHLSSRK